MVSFLVSTLSHLELLLWQWISEPWGQAGICKKNCFFPKYSRQVFGGGGLGAALGLHCCAWAFSSCSEQGLLFVEVRGFLIAVASLVAEHGFQACRLQ